METLHSFHQFSLKLGQNDTNCVHIRIGFRGGVLHIGCHFQQLKIALLFPLLWELPVEAVLASNAQGSHPVLNQVTSGKQNDTSFLRDASGAELTRNNNGSDGMYWLMANAHGESSKGADQLTVAASDENELHQAELQANADRFFQQGIEALQISQYQAAIDLWQSALKIYRDIGDQQSEVNTLGNLGLAYRSQGAYQQAIDLHQQSLAIAREIGDRLAEANALGNLGSAYHGRGAYQQSIDFSQQFLAIAREVGDRKGEAIGLGNLGLAYHSRGEYQQAIDSHQQSLAIAREIGDRLSESNALRNLGIDYHRLGDYQQAINSYQKSLTIAREIDDRQGEANSLGNLVLIYRRLGAYQQAIDSSQQFLVIVREIGDRQGESLSLGNLGLVHQSLGNYQQAIDFYQEQLVIARDIDSLQSEANALGNLGLAYQSLGDYQQAIDFYQKQLVIARDIGDRQGEAFSLGSLGFVYLKQERAILAEEVLFEAVSILDGLRSSELPDQDRINFFETQAQTYKNLELALALQNKVSEALEVADRGRARSFVQLVSERLSKNNEAQILSNPLSFSEMQKVAGDQQSVLVEYSLVSTTEGRPFLYIWVMQPTGELVFRQVALGDEPERLSELVSQSREAIRVRGRGFELASSANDVEATDKLRELHQLMIEPIADLLPSDPEQRVVFIPQGELFLVPFPALMDESGTYLIERHTMLTAPSIQVLDLTQQQSGARNEREASTTDSLIVGNPVMPEVWNPEKAVATQLAALIGAEQEAEAIASLFNTEALLGAQATEEAVKAKIGNARIVHLATHGLLEYGTPEDSGVRDVPGAIALAPSQGEDGLLTSAEILELKLQADLVVLSACDTGLGTITGDGVIGLSRSLIAAGTPSVIVSLWSIPDAPTAELMTEFYRQRQQGKDKAQALRQAMLVTMESHPNPGAWAAFTLIGEAD
jgi:CHAT domain-containing protein